MREGYQTLGTLACRVFCERGAADQVNREPTYSTAKLQKIGSTKWRMFGQLMEDKNIDCLAISEHHISLDNYTDTPNTTIIVHPSQAIKGYYCASKQRTQKSGGLALYWRKSLNVEN